jgi:hypothetical protein
VFQLALWAHQNAYRATILRAPKGNVGLAVRKTVVALINQTVLNRARWRCELRRV